MDSTYKCTATNTARVLCIWICWEGVCLCVLRNILEREKTKLDFDSWWQRENNYKATDKQTTQILNAWTQARKWKLFSLHWRFCIYLFKKSSFYLISS